MHVLKITRFLMLYSSRNMGFKADERNGGKKGDNMTEISLKEMLEAGVHFGHKSDRWNPKMAPFIYAEKNGVHIFDLSKTKKALEEAIKFVSDVSSKGGTILFVGTKNQTKEIIKEAARNAGMPFIAERWPGGLLTNFITVLSRLKYMKDSEEKLGSGDETTNVKGVTLTKKEALTIKRELEKLNSVFEGVKEMKKAPDVVFVADLLKESIAVKEAQKLGIPVIGIADTNSNPNVEYIIPGNDDAVRSVKYIADKISESISENKKSFAEIEAELIQENKEEKETEDKTDEKLEKIEMKAEEKTVVKKTKVKEDK